MPLDCDSNITAVGYEIFYISYGQQIFNSAKFKREKEKKLFLKKKEKQTRNERKIQQLIGVRIMLMKVEPFSFPSTHESVEASILMQKSNKKKQHH